MKSLITRGILIASLTFAGNAAMAAIIPAHKHASVSHQYAAIRVAPRLPRGQLNADVGQFIQSMFGHVQYSRLAQDARRAPPSYRSSGSTDWSPSYDNSSSASSSATDAQAASDAESQAIQSMMTPMR